jgi:radical SAM superfamily enzyme YgiQ (UPF0313 family)
LERVLVLDANARLKGRRLTTLDVIGSGPRVVSALLNYYGFKAELHPYEHFISNKDILKEFDVLAISFMVSDIKAVKKAVDFWRKNRGRERLVILGGPGALSIKALKLLDFDIAFLGEAESIFNELFNIHGYKSFIEFFEEVRVLDRIPKGIAVKKDDKLLDGGIAPWTPRELLFKVLPDIDGVRRYPFYWACRVYVEVVRGCSNFRRPLATSNGKICIKCNLCTSAKFADRLFCPVGIPPGCGYCSVPLIHGYPRSRDRYSIVEEVRKLLNIGVTRIVLSAPDFLDYGRDLSVKEPITDPCSPPPNIEAIENLLKDLVSLEKVADEKASILIENVKACLVDEYVAETLGRYLKGVAIYIGLESCSDRLLEAIGRPNKCKDVLTALQLLSRHGLKPYVYLMRGLYLEKTEDIAKTINVIPILQQLGVERIVLYKFRPLPRTAFSKVEKVKDPEYQKYVELLKNKVKEFNEYSKEKLMNKIVDVVIASEYPRNKRYLVSYPLYHGPVVLLRASRRFIGCIARVRIMKVISDRIVLGSIIYIRNRIVNLNTIT